MTEPVVSVVMPVYNSEEFLMQSVQSILCQTERDLELIAIDDGSTDGSGQLLEELATGDPRMRVIRRENRGLVKTLNEGFDIARGRFIARMDADDVSLPLRLERQLAFMHSHPTVGILGCWSQTMSGNRRWVTRFPSDHASICARMVFSTAISHPTSMFRKEMLHATGLRYDDAYRHAEDYALWAVAAKKTQLANLPEILFHYRLHAQQVSKRYSVAQANGSDMARWQMLEFFGIHPAEIDWELHKRLCLAEPRKDSSFEVQAKKWLFKMTRIVAGAKHPMAKEFGNECCMQARHLYYVMHPVASLPMRALRKFKLI